MKLIRGKVYKLGGQRVVFRGWRNKRKKALVHPVGEPNPKSRRLVDPDELMDWRPCG